MRGVEERLAWFLSHRPDLNSDGRPDAGACANHVWRSLDIPAQGFPDATAAWRHMQANGHMQPPTDAPPRGAIMLWTGGSSGHGHAALSGGGWQVASTDVNGPATVGVKPMGWFAANWPNLRYRGWTWWWGAVNTYRRQESVMAWGEVGSDKVIEVASKTLPDGQYGEVGRIDLPTKGHYLLTLQGRLPAGACARVQFRRVGWGPGVTGNDPWTPPDDNATSFTHNHCIRGGGPVAFEVKPYSPAAASTTVTDIVVKAVRIC